MPDLDIETPHHRVTPTGQALGKSAARMAELGRRRLESAGLTGLNLPTVRDEMCASCACRPGSVPNGCLQTQMDFLKAVIEGTPFLCHAPRDGRMCAGWIRARAQHVAEPVPAAVQALVARWEYSPADEPNRADRRHGEET